MRTSAIIAMLLMTTASLPSRAQTIQLPQFHVFSVDTTVLAPDSGPAPLAMDRRASYGAGLFNGVPGQRAIGVERQAVGAQVRARIHDPQEREERLFREAEARRAAAKVSQAGPGPDFARAAGDAPALDPSEIERRRLAAAANRHRAALALIERAKQADSRGKPSVAASYYRAAARGADPALTRQIEARLAKLRARQLDSATTSSEAAPGSKR